MISFEFTDAQLEVQRMARELAQKKVAPTIQKHDREQSFDPQLLKDMADADLNRHRENAPLLLNEHK